MAIHMPASQMTAERRFYTGMALLMIAIVLIGFGPSFYFRGYLHSPRPNPSITPFVLTHGLAFSLWMLVFLAQTSLVAANRRDLHRQLGIAGMILAVLLIPLMYLAAVGQVERANQPPFATPLSWTAVPLFPMPALMLLVWLGWKYRREPQSHKRLMLGASIIMMDPAIGRVPIAPPTLIGFAVLNAITLLLFLPVLWWDRKSRSHVHWATALGTGLLAIAMLLRLIALAEPGWWEPLAARLPGV